MITVVYTSHGHNRYFRTDHIGDAKLLELILKKHDPEATITIWED